MTVLDVLIDSSTRHSSKTNQFGESAAAWAAWWRGSSTPVAAGVHYRGYEGPNRTFYLGIIDALHHCLDLEPTSVVIQGDCQFVLRQLREEIGVDAPAGYRDYGKELEDRLGCPVSYLYLGESDPMYKRIDKLSKEGRGLVRRLVVDGK